MTQATKIALVAAGVVTFLTALTLISFYTENKSLSADPEDVRDCDSPNNYPLKRTKFDVDHSIEPKAKVKMVT